MHVLAKHRTQAAEITPLRGRALAETNLQVTVEQADPLGSALNATACHCQVFLAANAFNGNFVLLFWWKHTPHMKNKPWNYICVHLCVCFFIILMQSSLSKLHEGLQSCAQIKKALSSGSTKGTYQKGKQFQQRA